MKVLLVHNRYRSSQPSGENAVVEDEHVLLREAGCEVELLETTSDDIQHFDARRKAALPLTVVWSRRAARLVDEAVAASRPDVVHVHNTFPLLSPAALRAAHARAPVVQTVHNFRPLCAAATLLRDGAVCEKCVGRAPVAAIRHACYRGSRIATAPVAAMIAVHRSAGTWNSAVDRFVFPSAFALSKFVEAGWPPEKLVVKPNTAPAAGAPRVGPGRGFVCLSRLVPEKGIDVLVAAYAAAFPDAREPLAIVGAGPDREELVRAAADGIVFAGQLDRPDALRRLAGARALVVPSRWYEVFPRIIVEAFSLGVPVVASNIGSLADIVVDGENGLLVEPGSAPSLAAALARLSSDDELCERLGSGARRAYDALYTPERTTAGLLEIYAEARREWAAARASEAVL